MSSEAHQEELNQYCYAQKATYDHRVYVSDSYNWCVVPEAGQDAILFAGIAVVVACLAQGRFSNSIILLTGAAVQGFMLPYNLGRFGNGIAIWLGIQPYQLFFYIFLPPLLLDAAVRIDFFLFKKVVVQVITLAFLVVGASVGVMIPIMLYVLDLHSSGWTWQYVALFISMLASTDAVAIIATMKTSGGPRKLRVLLEGEALLNDASSFTLFEIFLTLVEQLNTPSPADESGWHVFWEVVKSALKLAGGGLGIGLAFGIVCRYVLRFMRYMGATIDQQVSLTLALAYLSYYTANSPAACSGVVAVAVYGLYGAATSKWDMSAKVEESGAFDAFWDTLSFVVNGLIFFFSGVACINFFVRSSEQLKTSGQSTVLGSTIWRLPLIYIFMFVVRFLLTAAFKPFFKIFLGDISWRELLFATAAGLRGSVSLILAQAVVTDQQTGPSGTNNAIIKSEIVLWTAGFVLMTLVINVPLLPLILRKTGLSKVSDGKQRMRKRAVKALANHTLTSIDNLKQDEDEMLRGVDWSSVAAYCTIDNIYSHFQDPALPPNSGQSSLLSWPSIKHSFARNRKSSGLLPQKSSLVEASGKLDTDKFFGRTKGWGSPDDLESAVFSEDDEFLSSDKDKLDEASENNDANELSTVSGSEFPFLSRQPAKPQGMTRSKTFASLTRHSLLPITKAGEEPGTLAAAAGVAVLDRRFKAGPVPLEPEQIKPPPTDDELKGARGGQQPADLQAESIGRRTASIASGSGDNIHRSSYVMTSAGPLLAPMASLPGKPVGEDEASVELSRHDSPSSLANLPKLRISGEALRKLVAEGTSGKTWPKMRSVEKEGRPPLPFKPQLSSGSPGLTRDSSTEQMESMDLNDASNNTWSGPPPNLNSLPSSTSTWRRSVTTGGGRQQRPSLFDAFDIDRPATRHAQKAVAKHKTIFDAFGVMEPGGSLTSQPSNLNRLDSANSTGSGKGRIAKAPDSDTESPQQTWTAGMTKGVPPKALITQLKRNRSAPDLEDGEASLAASGPAKSEDTRSEPPAGDASDMDRAFSVKPPPMGHLSESELIEARVRLIVGLKRYFHGKRIEGLLSSAALRILDNACDNCLEDPKCFNLWESIEKDATGTILVSWLAHQTYFWRKVVIMLTRRHHDGYRIFTYSRRAMAYPIRKAIGVAHAVLTRYMLTGIEVSIEYMLSITYSPQVQLLKRHETAQELLEEIQDELDKVWKFILDREVEAPERFQAIQTYRATTAVLKQQLVFIKNMYESGIVDDLERDELLSPLDKRERHLERKGPTYRNPGVVQILHNLPFLRHAPNRIVEILYRHGRLQMYPSGTDLAVRQTQSMFVVTSGLLKVSYTDLQGNLQEYFLASGGMLGLYTALTGQCLPGKVEAIAEGNAMGKGPVVFELFQSGINLIRKQAAAGNDIFQQIELDMMRLAALYIVERLKPRLMPYLLMLLSQQQATAGKAAKERAAAGLGTLPSPFAAKNAREDDTCSHHSRASAAFTTESGGTLGSQEQLRDAVLQQYTTLLHELAASEILELPAGIPFMQRSSAVLLKGTLKVSGRRYAEGRKSAASGEETVVEYHAPFVFPLVPPADGQPPAKLLRFVAGYRSSENSGALLMVCPGDGVEEDPLPSVGSEAEMPSRSGLDIPGAETSMQVPPAAAASAASPAAASSPGTAASAAAKPSTASVSRPNLRRVSKALILNTSDTSEHIAAKRSDGKKGEWWENALSRPSQALTRLSHVPDHLHPRRREAIDEE